MTQASKIQDEPSMEEILASIRRIIEDSDSVQGQGVAVKTVANDRAAAAPVPAEKLPAGTTAEGWLAGDGQRNPPEKPAIRAAEALRPRDLPETRPELGAVQEERKVTTEAGERAADAGPLPAAQAAGKDGQMHSEVTPPVRRFFEKAEKPAGVKPEAAPESAPSVTLVSEKAGLQVAAAFDELSTALEESRRRGFEKMAEEMMRPMLRDWLNDHLPGLVERLVREEIARITEGKPR